MTQPHQRGLDGSLPAMPTLSDRGTGARIEPARRRGLRWWILLTAVFAAALVSLRIIGSSGSWLEDIYRCISLFTANTGWGFDRLVQGATAPVPLKNANLVYRGLAIVAPVITALGLVELITGRVGRVRVFLGVLARLYLTPRRGVGIFGLTEQSYQFARDVRSGKGLAFIVTEDQDTALADRCERAGIAVCAPAAGALERRLTALYRRRADAGEPADLPAMLHRAHTVVSFLPEIGKQIDLAARLAQWSPTPAAASDGLAPIPPRLCLMTADRGLTQMLEDRLILVADKRAAAKVQPRLLDAHDLAARQLLTKRPFDVLADAFGQTRIHLAIYGFGTLGRSIVKHAAQLYVTRPSLDGVKLRVSVFDQQGGAALASLLAENPGIDRVIDIEVMPADTILPGGLSEAQATSIVPADVTGHILAFKDDQLAFTTALSLRRWLLQPPGRVDTGWRHAHRLAPIFVPAADWTGIGGLYQDVPDGVWGYGALHDGLAPSAIMDDERERGAMAIHAAYAERVKTEPGWSGRPAEADWAALSPALRESNFHAYDHVAIKARAIGYRFVPLTDEAAADPWSPDENKLDLLARLEHLRYMAERQATSWRPAARRLDAVRVHPDLIEWTALPVGERRLDQDQIADLPKIAAATKRRFAPAFVVGVSGYSSLRPGMTEDAVKTWLSDTLVSLRNAKPHHAMVLLTSLARGTDIWAAEAAAAEKIPFIVPLPLPYELLRENFAARELAAFNALIAKAECSFELPTPFGAASELTSRHRPSAPPGVADPNLDNRARQYALAGAYILERADEMIYVIDPTEAAKDGADVPTGSAHQVWRWRERGLIEQEYRTPARFFPRPDRMAGGLVFPPRSP